MKLAERGWQVTSIDIVDKALQRARERVREADVDMRVVHADVTALREADVGSDFRLVLDTGPSTASPMASARRWVGR